VAREERELFARAVEEELEAVQEHEQFLQQQMERHMEVRD
jgi:hypothetical protein